MNHHWWPESTDRSRNSACVLKSGPGAGGRGDARQLTCVVFSLLFTRDPKGPFLRVTEEGGPSFYSIKHRLPLAEEETSFPAVGAPRNVGCASSILQQVHP